MNPDGTLRDVTETYDIERKGNGIFANDEQGNPVVVDARQYVSMNMWGLPPKFLDALEAGFPEFLDGIKEGDVKAEYLLPKVIDQQIKSGKAHVRVLETRDKWFGVTYKEVPLTADDTPDYDAIPDAVRGAKVAYIQRSRGYSLRPALTVAQIQRMAELVRSTNPDAVIMVDNCYGEFVETSEPVEVGCDLMIGSMIKNVGGGIARTGGYIAGKEELVQQCAERLTCIGMGKEVGCTLDVNRELYLGFFHAPDTTANALKTADFAASLFGGFGFSCHPPVGTTRGDIVEAICLGDEAHLTAFCQGIQQGSPVDSFVIPEAWDMPGYNSKVIMAAGAFTMGASIELSADEPIREPFAVWMQGGMTYTTGKIGVLLAAQKMLEQGLLSL